MATILRAEGLCARFVVGKEQAVCQHSECWISSPIKHAQHSHQQHSGHINPPSLLNKINTHPTGVEPLTLRISRQLFKASNSLMIENLLTIVSYCNSNLRFLMQCAVHCQDLLFLWPAKHAIPHNSFYWVISLIRRIYHTRWVLHKHFCTTFIRHLIWHLIYLRIVYVVCEQIRCSMFSQGNTCLECQRVWKYRSGFYQVLPWQPVANKNTRMSTRTCGTHNPPQHNVCVFQICHNVLTRQVFSEGLCIHYLHFYVRYYGIHARNGHWNVVKSADLLWLCT